MGVEVRYGVCTALWSAQSGKPRKSRERKRSKRLKRQQPECKEKYRERHYRANPKQHHKLSKPSAKASIKIFGFVFARIALPARELNDRAVLFSHLVFSRITGVFGGERASPHLLYCLTTDAHWGSYSVRVAAQSR